MGWIQRQRRLCVRQCGDTGLLMFGLITLDAAHDSLSHGCLIHVPLHLTHSASFQRLLMVFYSERRIKIKHTAGRGGREDVSKRRLSDQHEPCQRKINPFIVLNADVSQCLYFFSFTPMMKSDIKRINTRHMYCEDFSFCSPGGGAKDSVGIPWDPGSK